MKPVELLQRVSLFQNIHPEELGRLASVMALKEVGKESQIVAQDEMGDALYVIAKGRVKVVLYGDGGKEVILSMLREGDFFGEMSLLDDLPRSASVVACENSKVLVLRREQFVDHVQKSPRTALNIMAELSRRLRHADEIIGNLSTLDVYGRVAHILMDLAKKDGEDIEEGILIKSRPTQQEIASMIGTSRETVSRVLSEFQKRGYIETRGRQILMSRQFAREVEETFANQSTE